MNAFYKFCTSKVSTVWGNTWSNIISKAWLCAEKWNKNTVVLYFCGSEEKEIVWWAYNYIARLDKVILLSPETLQLLSEINVIKKNSRFFKKALGL